MSVFHFILKPMEDSKETIVGERSPVDNDKIELFTNEFS